MPVPSSVLDPLIYQIWPLHLQVEQYKRDFGTVIYDDLKATGKI